jgi:hypothetical protein
MPVPEKEFEAASKALFALEEALAPPTEKSPLKLEQRRRIYALRCEVNALLGQERARVKREGE